MQLANWACRGSKGLRSTFQRQFVQGTVLGKYLLQVPSLTMLLLGAIVPTFSTTLAR
jgi:hypothetical protein